MLLNFKSKIKTFVNQKVGQIKKHQSQTQQIALDYAQISRLFPESNFIPFTSWSISPSVILHVLNDITINKRRTIIEFGSGASTLYIAKLIQTLQLDVKFYSVESSEEWCDKMREELEMHKLDGIVTLIHAPLTDAKNELCLMDQKLWYDTAKIVDFIGDKHEFDLIIVDGPYGGSTPYARYSAIPFLQDRLCTNYSVFLDDTRRVEEEEIVKQWSNVLKVTPQRFDRYTYFTKDNSFITNPYRVSSL